MSDVETIHTKALFQSNEDVHQCCGEGMFFVAHVSTWNDDEPDFDNYNPSLEDFWICSKCATEKPSRRYRDWFGHGDTDVEVQDIIDSKGDPLKVMYDGYMACMIYPHEVIVHGYDGNEYCHGFGFSSDPLDLAPLNLRVKEEIVMIPEDE